MSFIRYTTQLLLVALILVSFASAAKRPTKPGSGDRSKRRGKGAFGCSDNDLAKNISALWDKVNMVTQPIEVHVHDNDRQQCDDYFGCDFGHRRRGHRHGSHSHHHGKHNSSHGSHSHKHGSHGHHGSHGYHGSHGSHGSHGHHGHRGHHARRGINDNHIHIHMSVNKNDDCRVVSYRPKDEFVYARCDMKSVKGQKVKGSILMRQKPHQAIETKILLTGFKGPSTGAKEGKHDFFFDLHKLADFSDGCTSFGNHHHEHYGYHGGRSHGSHSHGSHSHKSHSHKSHAHKSEEEIHREHHPDGHVHDHIHNEGDWGNVIINARGKAKMEANTTRHELFGPKSIFGRGIVLHDANDVNVACCAITYANIDDESWEKQ